MAVSENDLVVGPLTPAAGVTTISIDFYFEQASWLEVYKAGSETPLVLNTDYTVAGTGSSSGVVTLTTPANGTDTYAIYLSVPLRRSSDMQLRGEFKSEPFNIEMDRLWQRLQHHNTLLGRSLKVSRTADAPSPYTPEAETVVGFDAQGGTTLYPVNAAVTLNLDPEEVVRRDNAAAVLADTGMGYTAGASVQVSAGQFVLTTAEGFSYKVAASGATDHHVTTTGGLKLNVISGPGDVADIGAFGVTGTGDQTTRLEKALQALAAGEIAALDFGNAVASLESEIAVTLTANAVIRASAGGGIKAENTSALDRLINIDTAGYDLTLEGLLLNGANKVPQLYQVRNAVNSNGIICLKGNRHLNVRRELTRDGQGVADAVHVRGGFQHVEIAGNLTKSIVREAGVGVSGSAGSTGIVVFQDTSTGTNLYAKSLLHRGNTYDTVDTEDTGANRGDCDGLKYFTGEVAAGDDAFFESRFVSTGNKYTDCAGRAIKGQVSHGIVQGETIVRAGVLAIDNFSDITMQMGSGSVSDIEAFYNPVGGLSPFTSDGGAAANGSVVDFYTSPKSGREIGGATVSNIRVYNNVAPATGTLNTVVGFSTNGEDTGYPIHATLKDAKVFGGAVRCFAIAPVKGTGSPKAVITLKDNYAANLTGALVGVASGTENQLHIIAEGNVNMSGTDVLAAEVTYSQGNRCRCYVEGHGNIGVQRDAPRMASDSVGAVVPLRTNAIFPIAGPTEVHGGFNIENAMIADGATHTFRQMGYSAYGLYFLSCNVGEDGQAVFGMDVGGVNDISGGGSTAYAFGAGADPGTAGKINVWHDGTNLHITNRIGSTRVFLLGCFG